MLLYNVIISWFAGIWIEALRMQSDVRIITPTAVVALFGMPASALAQDPGTQVIGTAMLPRDLSPWGMYLSADPVVKAVLIGLLFASIVTWTVWFAKPWQSSTFLPARSSATASKSGSPPGSSASKRYAAGAFRAPPEYWRPSAPLLPSLDYSA